MIAIACDAAGYELKKEIITHLEKKGFKMLDFGTNDGTTAIDYPDFAYAACEAVVTKKAEQAILICGTGIGMSIAANKVKGIRCALCGDTFSAKTTKPHNDTNVLALGARVTGSMLALDIVDAFINSEFSKEERHCRRVDKIVKIENEGKL